MIYAVHQPQYLPWLGFFDKIEKSDCFIYLDCVQYKHREYQNRNKIRTKEGWIWLSVPVFYKQGEPIRDVRIDNTGDWRSRHLKSIRHWYAGCEYFDRYFPLFEALYSKEWSRLIDLNTGIVSRLLEALGLRKKIRYESALNAGGGKTQRIINIGKAIGGDTYLSGQGGRDYLDERLFADADIKLVYQEYNHPVYRQRFAEKKDDFIAYLSVVDLLFNEGARSLDILKGERTDV